MSYVLFSDGTALVGHTDLLVLLASLRDAAEYRLTRPGDEHDDLAALAAYRLLSMNLGDDR